MPAKIEKPKIQLPKASRTHLPYPMREFAMKLSQFNLNQGVSREIEFGGVVEVVGGLIKDEVGEAEE